MSDQYVPRTPAAPAPSLGDRLGFSIADGLILGGAGVTAAGLALWYAPAAFIAIGVGMILTGLRAAGRER